MRLALLDHPWPLDAVFDDASDGFGVLTKFEDLRQRYGMTVVPFVPPHELDALWARLDHQNSHTAGYAALMRCAEDYRRDNKANCTATPNPGPGGLTVEWRRALKDAMSDQGDWRNPQIIISRVRRDSWPQESVSILFETCNGQPASDAGSRVVIQLELYETHRFALSDFDPWDLRHIHPPPPDAQPFRGHLCFLPKPPIGDFELSNLEDALRIARAKGWILGGKRYFIPDENWRPENVIEESWRRGRAFRYQQCRGSGRSGYVDFEGREWVWDVQERHWDVQTDPYIRVAPTGETLD